MRFLRPRILPGWTAIPLLALAGAAAMLFSACKKQKAATASGGKQVTKIEKRAGPPDQDFREAREAILVGNFSVAVEEMRKLAARSDVPEQYGDWVLIFGGMAELLVNREKEARAYFAQLSERNASMRTSGKMPPFLYDLGIAMAGEGGIATKAASRYDRSTHEAYALFLFGLKNEHLGQNEDALTFYRQFATASARGPELWTGFNAELKQFRQMAIDFCEYEELVDAATKSRAVAAGEGAVEKAVSEAREVRKRIKWESKLIVSLDAQLGDKSKVMAAADDADAEAFPAAKAKWLELATKFEFGEARQAIFEAKLSTHRRIKEQEIMSAHSGYLDQFKFFLLLEARDEGYAKPVKLKNGESAEAIAKLDDSFVYLRTKSGEKQVPWKDMALESIFEMGKSLITADEEPSKAAIRKWNLGNFAAFIGMSEEAKTLLNDAAKLNPQLAPEVEPILALNAKAAAQ